MQQLRHWWATTLGTILTWLGTAWQWFASSITERWDITFFVIAAATILLIGLIVVWRRGH